MGEMKGRESRRECNRCDDESEESANCELINKTRKEKRNGTPHVRK